MKLMGAFLFFFLFVIVSGTISYIYLMWTNYWIRIKALEEHIHIPHRLHRVSDTADRQVLHRKPRYDTPEDLPVKELPSVRKRPRINLSEASPAPKKKISLSKLPKDKLLAHLKVYKEQIHAQLRNTVMDTGKQVQSDSFPNAYNVTYSAKFGNEEAKFNAQQILCDARKYVRTRTFTKEDAMFKKLKLDRFFPKNEFLEGKRFNTCAVVTSAGSLKNSKLGAFIDSHDVVLRFNNAPTEDYAKDVGTKTTIRIVNSQVVAKPHFKFLESKIYSDSSVLVWDPSAYNGSLEEWYSKPDWPFFEQFFSKRLMQPEDSLYLLNPATLWSIWRWIQSMTAVPLLPTPPSSGFLGLVLLLEHCSLLHVLEYIPSMRLTKRCHYYEEEENLGCTLGDWHPLAAEKLLAMAMHTGDDLQLLHRGILTIPGFSTCPST